jgi:hypothetical protein
MNAGIGIVLLVVFAIGAASVLFWTVKQVGKAYRNFFVKDTAATVTGKKPKFLKIGHGRVLTNYDDLPHYKGRVGLFGLPVYEDVIVPDKHDYKTVVYMDNWFKQYVYDLMASWKAGFENKDNPYGALSVVVFLAAPFLFNKALGIVILAGVVLLFLFLAPSGNQAVRRMAENAKNFTPETWRQIYMDVVKDMEFEDSIARAIRKSGVRRF